MIVDVGGSTTEVSILMYNEWDVSLSLTSPAHAFPNTTVNIPESQFNFSANEAPLKPHNANSAEASTSIEKPEISITLGQCRRGILRSGDKSIGGVFGANEVDSRFVIFFKGERHFRSCKKSFF